MQLHYFQKGFNYSQDGPGNRLVYHLCGCNMRCPWCSNPEGMRLNAGCARGESVQAVVQTILSASPMYFDGGGVTFTGGEATLQLDALKEALTLTREGGVNTCIETNASHPRLVELFPLLDTLIADFKHPDTRLHEMWTGVGNEQVKKNLLAARDFGLPLQLRVPLIHGVNDDNKALEGFLAFFSTLKHPDMTVEFLRYHEYGKDKWLKLGLEYQMKNAFLSPQRAKQFENACIQAGLCVIRT